MTDPSGRRLLINEAKALACSAERVLCCMLCCMPLAIRRIGPEASLLSTARSTRVNHS